MASESSDPGIPASLLSFHEVVARHEAAYRLPGEDWVPASDRQPPRSLGTAEPYPDRVIIDYTPEIELPSNTSDRKYARSMDHTDIRGRIDIRFDDDSQASGDAFTATVSDTWYHTADEIEALLDEVPPWSRVSVAPTDNGITVRSGEEVADSPEAVYGAALETVQLGKAFIEELAAQKTRDFGDRVTPGGEC